MDIVKKVQSNVSDGMVLDDNGRWVPIAHMLAKEREIMNHLRRGRVIVGGQWVPIENAREMQQSAGAPPHRAQAGLSQVTGAAYGAPGPTSPPQESQTLDPAADLIAALGGDDEDGFMIPIDQSPDNSTATDQSPDYPPSTDQQGPRKADA